MIRSSSFFIVGLAWGYAQGRLRRQLHYAPKARQMHAIAVASSDPVAQQLDTVPVVGHCRAVAAAFPKIGGRRDRPRHCKEGAINMSEPDAQKVLELDVSGLDMGPVLRSL
jgi:hypothetical protein